MQTKLLTLGILCMLGLRIQSQTTFDYLSRPGLTIASVHINWFDGSFNNSYKFTGDTLLCGEKLLIFEHSLQYTNKTLLRVEEGKVWRKSFNNPCANEQLMYDFGLEVGDTTDAYYFKDYYVVETGTITLLNGEKRKQLFLTKNANNTPIMWVDGIGSLDGGLFQIPDFEGYTSLICVKENDQTIWINPDQSNIQCDSIACFNPVPEFDFDVNQFQVNFNNQSSNLSSVHWNFGDGKTSNEFHGHHNYESPGCYNVTLTLGSDCLTRTFKKQLSVPVCIAQEWKVKSPDLTNGSILIDFVNTSTGWAITTNRIWKTEDRGASWAEQFYPIPAPPVRRILSTIDMVDEMNGVIAVINYSAPSSIEAFLVTNDGGLTWKEKMPGSYLIISAIMTYDGQVFGSGQFDGMFYSNDWGNSFVELSSQGIDFSQFQYLGNKQVVALGLQGSPPNATRAISYSDDSGQSWKHSLLPATYYLATGFHYFNAKIGFLCGYKGFLIKTEDGGQSWEEISYNDDRIATNIYFLDDQTGWAVGENGLVISTTDGGNTWVVGNCGYRNNLLSISALDVNNCWLGSGNGKYLEFDPDAKTECSPVSITELNLSDDNLLIFPNPANVEVTIKLTKSNVTLDDLKISISNSLGQNMYEGNMIHETLTINTETWNSGAYWIKCFRNEQFIGTKKLIVLD